MFLRENWKNSLNWSFYLPWNTPNRSHKQLKITPHLPWITTKLQAEFLQVFTEIDALRTFFINIVNSNWIIRKQFHFGLRKHQKTTQNVLQNIPMEATLRGWARHIVFTTIWAFPWKHQLIVLDGFARSENPSHFLYSLFCYEGDVQWSHHALSELPFQCWGRRKKNYANRTIICFLRSPNIWRRIFAFVQLRDWACRCWWDILLSTNPWC